MDFRRLYIEALTQPLGRKQYDFVVGHYERDGKASPVFCSEGEYHKTGLRFDGCKGVPVSAWDKLFRRSFLIDNQLSFEVGKVFEDSVFTFDLACLDSKFYAVESITYHYRRRENSIITRESQDKVSDCIGVFQCIRNRVGQEKYKNLDGIYDYYLFWVKRIFDSISCVEMDETMFNYVQKETQGFLDVIPNMRYLSDKHDRLICFLCRKDQTYCRFQYVRQRYADKYAKKLSVRMMRKLLSWIPPKKA